MTSRAVVSPAHARPGRTRRAGAASPVEERLLRTAALRIAAQFAVAAMLLLAVVGAVVFGLDRQAADGSASDTLRSAVATADDVHDPPAGVLLVLRAAAGDVRASPGTPQPVADGALLGRPVGRSHYRTGSASYDVLTVARPGGVRVQALYDVHRGRQERDRLLTALLLADGLGAVGAAVVGGLLARRAIRPLSDALALQRRFVADASHELRAPLTVLHTRAQLLRRTHADDQELQAELEALVQDSRAMTEVVDDLLTSAELPHRPAARELLDLADIAAQVAASFGPVAATTGIRLDTRLGGPVLVRGAPAALRRAVSALVDNALGHEHPGGTVMLAVGLDEPSGPRQWARLTVADTGVGLDADRAQELFARFARGTGATGTGRRFGLGLALVRDVVIAHEGRLDVAGAPGKGATFTILLPAQAPQPDPGRPAG